MNHLLRKKKKGPKRLTVTKLLASLKISYHEINFKRSTSFISYSIPCGHFTQYPTLFDESIKNTRTNLIKPAFEFVKFTFFIPTSK